MEEPYRGKSLEEYLELLNKELEDHATLVEISVKRQGLQLEEKLTLRQMQFRRYRRKIKEQVIKTKQRSMIKQRSILREFKEPEAQSLVTGESKVKLEVTLKHLQTNYDSEDEEEVIDLSDTPKSAEEVNDIYNRKKAEINRVRKGFEKVMEDCRERNLHQKVIAKLHEKQMQTITQISNKFSKL